jgi:hypothetical protein
MTKSTIVQAIIVASMACGLFACKRSNPPTVSDQTSTEAVKPAPVEDKSPQYVKDLRKDVQKARDVGAVEQKAAEQETKAADEATK